MKFIFFLLLAVATTATARSDKYEKIRVTGDRVSLRAKPDLNAELLDRAMRGDEMICFERTNNWVAVQAPESLNFWVAKEFIQNGVVVPVKLNVRSGPSLNYNVMTVMLQGEKVVVRGEFPPADEVTEDTSEQSKWYNIAPPFGSRVWISEDYVEMVAPPKPVVTKVAPVVAPVAKAAPKPKPIIKREKATAEKPPLVLVLDKTRPQGKKDRIPGVLRRANPGLYKLVLITEDAEEPICLVRGRVSQLEKLLNRSVLMEGKMYWAKDVDLPVMSPEKITPDPIYSE